MTCHDKNFPYSKKASEMWNFTWVLFSWKTGTTVKKSPLSFLCFWKLFIAEIHSYSYDLHKKLSSNFMYL